MKINFSALHKHLKKNLAKLYWLSGDDANLQQEARTMISDKARACGFVDKKYFTVSAQFDDAVLWQTLTNYDLLAHKKIIIVQIAASKLTTTGANNFLDCVRALHADLILIIQSAKLEPSQYQTAWYQTGVANGIFIPLWPLTPSEWQQWLTATISSLGLNIDAAGIHALSQHVDGNLLAARNALTTLQLTYAEATIGELEVLALIAPHGDYTIIQLIDTSLNGDGVKAERILQQLRTQGCAVTQILAALVRELRLITLLSYSVPATDAELAPYRVWPQRKTLLQRASQRLNTSQWQHIFKLAHHCDKLAKGVIAGDVWLSLSQLLCTITTGINPFPMEFTWTY